MDWTAIGVGVSIIVMLGSLILYLHSSVMEEIKEMKQELRGIDQRISRLEGRFEERGYWESRRTGTEEKTKG